MGLTAGGKSMFTHLLVPTDGSPLSDIAIQMAVTVAKENHAKLTALHVLPEFRVFAYGAEMPADTEEHFLKVARQHAEDYLAAVTKAATQAGVECETVATTRAHPYEAIVSIATQRSCDLIVMASHGRSGLRALLIGSETQKVLTHSDVPVLVVRPPAPPRSSRGAESDTSSVTSQQSSTHPFITLRALP
jgi:nucleotide-binding universal stress UspA family protein